MIDYLWCLICHESHNGDSWTALPCGHYAHAACLQQSLKHRRSCPACRKRVDQHSEILLFDIHTSGENADQSQAAQGHPSGEESLGIQQRQGLLTVQASLSSSERDLKEAKDQLRLEAQQHECLKRKLQSLESRLQEAAELHNGHAVAMRTQRQLVRDAVESRNREQLERKALRSRLKVMEAKCDKQGQELTRMKMIHGELSHEELVGELKASYGDQKLEDPLVRTLLSQLEKARKDYGRLSAQAKQEVREAQQRAKDGVASTIKSLEKEVLEVKVENERIKSSSGACSLDLPVTSSNKRKVAISDEDLEDLLLCDDEMEQGLTGPPSFMIRPGAGFRPPPMTSGASSGSFVLQGADGRGGKVLSAAPLLRQNFAFGHRPAAAVPTATLSSMNQNLQHRKKAKPNNMKRAAANDIAKYFNKENALNLL